MPPNPKSKISQTLPPQLLRQARSNPAQKAKYWLAMPSNPKFSQTFPPRLLRQTRTNPAQKAKDLPAMPSNPNPNPRFSYSAQTRRRRRKICRRCPRHKRAARRAGIRDRGK